MKPVSDRFIYNAVCRGSGVLLTKTRVKVDSVIIALVGFRKFHQVIIITKIQNEINLHYYQKYFVNSNRTRKP